jgi:short-chain fatty acids transporter
MTKNLLDRFAQAMGRVVPDAITACVMLLVLLFAVALALGNSLSRTMEAYYQGLWMLLPFTMQMTLIITLSSALASTPLFRTTVIALSRLPKTRAQTIIVATLLTSAASYLYWGLGLALSPIVAIHFAREAERKGIRIDFLFFLAVTWASHAVWQFGLSASAPLLVATPGHFLQQTIGIIPLSTTIWSPAAIIHEVAFTAAVIAAGCLLMPKDGRPVSAFPEACKLTDNAEEEPDTPMTASERMERNSLFSILLCVALLGWLYVHFIVQRRSLDINSLNTSLLLFALLLHRNFNRFGRALQKAVLSAWPVIVLYHLYAGVAGLIQHTTVGEELAGVVAAVSTPMTFPLVTAAISAVFALFIPSSGGQWAIQGFVISKAALEVGVSVQRGILALSVGDHMGNLTSPFWYMVIAGIAHVDFRSFFGYGLLFAAIWFAVGVVTFTFAPC